MRSLVLSVALLTGFAAKAQPLTNKQYREDFQFFRKTIGDNYCYFEKKGIDWEKVASFYTTQMDTVTTRDAFVAILESALNELYDHHSSLGTNTDQSRRLVPTGADMWAEYVNNKPVIKEVRRGFGAEAVGVSAGMEVVAINDKPVEEAIAPFLLHNSGAEAKNFALRLALAGDHITKRKIRLKTASGTKDYFPDKDGMKLEHIEYRSKVESRQMGKVGYIKVNNFLYDNSTLASFDSVLDSMMVSDALIIDLRETPSGGNTTVARGILGRFITEEKPYQKHELYYEEKLNGVKRSWIEIVSPRKAIYSKPVVILANHWTGSIAEGITIAFDGMKRATVIGTELARLNGAIDGDVLPNSKIAFRFPTERLYHVNGTPRELYKPTIEVDLAKQKPWQDVILQRAMEYLKRKK